ncbi:MAG: tRNA (N6-threonylcarbamoyladenosine(37)-N6)-methyltransferase TrmO [Oscillospiraceae bacterium]|nr:tRNA (N6-threonylcarbamoyladenosine(37)-N6)-methyltransferase TrmO [Oscillospiraceae bacterium]
MTIHPIAHIRSDFPTKFGIPRQSGMVDELTATLVFEPQYRNTDALRGLDGFSHLWLIWGFSVAEQTGRSPTVRPPRLGGNARLGVFATRSPFRPNPLGLSAVAIEEITEDPALGPVIHVRGADLLDGTPIYDIKPYLPYANRVAEATGGFAEAPPQATLEVRAPDELTALLPPEKRKALKAILALDPRPPYQQDANRVYGLQFAGFEIRFRVAGEVLTVVEVYKL